MMDPPLNLNLDDVKDFLLANDGKVKNSALVLNFKRYFNDPNTKNANKERFKDIVNKLASVKTENGEKIIVLKKKYRPDARTLPSVDSVTSVESVRSATLSMDSEAGEAEPLSAPLSRGQSLDMDSDQSSGRSKSRDQSTSREQSKSREHSKSREQSKSREESVTREEGKSDEAGYEADASRESSLAPDEAAVKENSPIVSVKHRANFLNKMSEKPPAPKDYRLVGKIGKTQKMLAEEERLQTVSLLDPVEHEWMMVTAKCDYIRMVRMLQDHPELARRKDYSTGYSGLHWACKHNNPDAVKLLAGSYQCPVNARSHGGYTALHIAAMQGNDEIMHLLTRTYGADGELRDFNGRKPKHYLQNTGKGKLYIPKTATSLQIKRQSKVTEEEVDAAMRRAGAESHQGIGTFLNPQRASFRLSKAMKRDGSPTMRRSNTTKFSSGSESSDKESLRNRPISVPVGVPKSQSDTEILKSSFV